MKKIVALTVIMVISMLLFTGCTNGESPDSSFPSQTAGPPESTFSATPEETAVKLIRTMMELDCASMTVEKFNETIQQLCTDADTTIFDAISHAYDDYAVYDDTGEFQGTVITDSDVEQFLKTTLSYSSQEIFGEPVHMGSILYITAPDMTALEMAQKKDGMTPQEWDRYFDDNIAEIRVFPVLSYEIEADIKDVKSITVSERDTRINGVHSAIKEYFLSLTSEAAASETLEEDLTAEFERLSSLNSDSKIRTECRIQALERDD